MKSRISKLDPAFVSGAALVMGAAGALALAIYSGPADAANVIFSSAQPNSQGTKLSPGQQTLPIGVTQIELDDGTEVSIIGPATYSVDTNGQLSVTEGAFTAIAPKGGTAMPILTGTGSVSLGSGGSVNGKIGAGGSFSGYTLTGKVEVSSNGSSQNFPIGSAFQAGGGAAPKQVATAGVQPNSSVSSVLQLIVQAQKAAAQYQANPNPASPAANGTGGVNLAQNPVIQQVLTLIQNNFPGNGGGSTGGGATGGGSTGGGSTGGGTPTTITDIASLFALIASGGTVPSGDPRVQSLLDMLTVLPPGVDVTQLRDALSLAGYTLPPVISGGGGTGSGGSGGSNTPVQIGTGNGVLPDASRTDLTLLYTTVSSVGTDQNVTVLYDANGNFSGYKMASGFQPDVTGTDFFGNEKYLNEYGADGGVIGIARVSGGTGALGLVRGANGGDHYVWGTPLVNRPASGTLQYNLIAATSPTIRDSSLSPGTFTGSLGVNFDGADYAMKWGLDGQVGIGSSTYNFASSGGAASPSMTGFVDGRFGGTIDIPETGVACNQGDCRVQIAGFLAGDGASHAGIRYTIRDDRSNNVTKWIDGAAAFKAVP